MPEIGGGSTFDGGTINNPINIINPGSPAKSVITGQQPGDVGVRFSFKGNGGLAMGDGTSYVDVLIARKGPDRLYTPDRFECEQFGVGTYALATTLGTVVGMYPLYDDADNLVGYVPVYDAIT